MGEANTAYIQRLGLVGRVHSSRGLTIDVRTAWYKALASRIHGKILLACSLVPDRNVAIFCTKSKISFPHNKNN